MKTSDSRQLLIRKVVGSILSSDLTARELEYLSNDLAHWQDFAVEISHALRMHISILNRDIEFRQINTFQDEHERLREMIDRIHQRRISKVEILNAIPAEIMPNISSSSLNRISVNDLLMRVFGRAPQNLLNDFMRRVGLEEEQDQYLMGIDKKR